MLLFETAGSTSIVKQIDIKESVLVIDGGKLLNLVSYAGKKGCQFNGIINAHVSHVKQEMNAGSHKSCTVIFDGYTTSPTKDHTHQARYLIRVMEVQVTFEKMLDSRIKDLFLNNPRNKEKFIISSERLRDEDTMIMTIHCEDAVECRYRNSPGNFYLIKGG